MKKIAIALALILLVVLSLGGCGNNDGNDSTGAEVKLNGEEVYPIECDDTITFWFNNTSGWSTMYNDFSDTPLAKELEKETGVKIEYVVPTKGSEEEQFQIMLANDELPDIVNYSWNNYPGGPDAAINDGYIYELNDIIDKYCPNLKKVLAEHPEWDKQVKTDSGKYFAFPQFSQGGILRVGFGPVVRADWMKKLNLDNPTTAEEWEKVLTAFKNDGAQAPFAGNYEDLRIMFMPAFGTYQDWYHDGDTVKYGQATPEYKEFLKTMHDWYEKGLIDDDFGLQDGERVDKLVLNSKSGATLAWAGGGIGGWLDAMKDDASFDLAGVQFPSMGDGGNAEYSYLMSDIGTTSIVAISKNCKNVELAARLLDYGYTEAGHNLYNFGIEGESYNWVDKDGEKYPQYTELITDNPDHTMSEMLSAYARSSFCNVPMIQAVEYMQQYYKRQQQKDAQKEWVKSNMDDHLMPLIYIATENSDEDADIMTKVKTYVDEMECKFINGDEPIENFDKYIETLKEFGIEKSVAFRQEAYDRYLKR